MSLCIPDSSIDLVCCLRDFLVNAVSFAFYPVDMGPRSFCDDGVSVTQSNAPLQSSDTLDVRLLGSFRWHARVSGYNI